MPPDRPEVAGQSSASRTPAVAKPSARSRSAATNRPASRWNSNTVIGRRCRDLFKGYMRALGDPCDEPTVALTIAAAEAVVLAEVARRECLAGLNGVNAELCIRFENTANRALRRIGLAKVAKAAPLSLAQQLAAMGHKPPDEAST